jgi:hypothetical protein
LPLLQLVLGGHDHHYEVSEVAPHGTHVFKSGTDFREFSVIRLQVPASLEGAPVLPVTHTAAVLAALLAGLRARRLTCVKLANLARACVTSSLVSDSTAERPQLQYQRVEINSAVPEDPEMAAIVKRYQDLIGGQTLRLGGGSCKSPAPAPQLPCIATSGCHSASPMHDPTAPAWLLAGLFFAAVFLSWLTHAVSVLAAGTKMDEPMGWAHTDLDARFDTVRTCESNLGSLFADVMRISLGADAAFFNGGTIRSDQVGAGGLRRGTRRQ